MNLGKVEIWETSLDRIVTLREGAKGVLRPGVKVPLTGWLGGQYSGPDSPGRPEIEPLVRTAVFCPVAMATFQTWMPFGKVCRSTNRKAT